MDGRGSRRLSGRDCADSCGRRRVLTLAFQSRAPHFATTFFVCDLCPVVDPCQKIFLGTQPDEREIFFGRQSEEALLAKQKQLAQPDKALVKRLL